MKKLFDLKIIERYGITLRLVDETDSEFIVKVRTELGHHISPTSDNIEDQKRWIRDYKIREENGLEYYFITVGPKNERWGTTRLSELDGDCFELGSWIFSKDAPQGVSIKADIITKEIGFDLLGFKCCKFDVRKQNKSVLKYHLNFNPVIVHENDLNFYFNLSESEFSITKKRFLKVL